MLSKQQIDFLNKHAAEMAKDKAADLAANTQFNSTCDELEAICADIERRNAERQMLSK